MNEFIKFTGEIILTYKGDNKFDEYISYLKEQEILGFDTESKPSFKKKQKNKLSLIQFSTYTRAILIKVIDEVPYEIYYNIFNNEKILKVGCGLKNDLAELKIENKYLNTFIDIQVLAKQRGIQQVSLQSLCMSILNKKINKKEQLSNWAAKKLTKKQLLYAATDAYACLLIFDRLKNEVSLPKT